MYADGCISGSSSPDQRHPFLDCTKVTHFHVSRFSTGTIVVNLGKSLYWNYFSFIIWHQSDYHTASFLSSSYWSWCPSTPTSFSSHWICKPCLSTWQPSISSVLLFVSLLAKLKLTYISFVTQGDELISKHLYSSPDRRLGTAVDYRRDPFAPRWPRTSTGIHCGANYPSGKSHAFGYNNHLEAVFTNCLKGHLP